MKKIYLLLIFIGLTCFSFTSGMQAQSSIDKQNQANSGKIEGIAIYPNPADGEKVFIVSKKQLTKRITIYSVLGKIVKFEVLFGKELDISNLNSGVYILKVKEEENEYTQKLIIAR